jgi:hypothetical protein
MKYRSKDTLVWQGENVVAERKTIPRRILYRIALSPYHNISAWAKCKKKSGENASIKSTKRSESNIHRNVSLKKRRTIILTFQKDLFILIGDFFEFFQNFGA